MPTLYLNAKIRKMSDSALFKDPFFAKILNISICNAFLMVPKFYIFTSRSAKAEGDCLTESAKTERFSQPDSMSMADSVK